MQSPVPSSQNRWRECGKCYEREVSVPGVLTSIIALLLWLLTRRCWWLWALWQSRHRWNSQPYSAGTLSHTQRCQPLINGIVLQARLPKPWKPGRRLWLSIFYQYITRGSARTSVPFPHFSISLFLISLFPIPAFRPTPKRRNRKYPIVYSITRDGCKSETSVLCVKKWQVRVSR